MKQLTFLTEKKYAYRKVARRISLRGGNHVVLKASRFILRSKRREIHYCIHRTQKYFGARLRAVAIMGDHIHLIIKVDRREQLANTLRMLTSLIAKRVINGKLWIKRAWSRPLKFGRDLTTAETYVAKNAIKAGVFDHEDTFLIIGGILQYG